jgi:hypothetical protein
MAIPECGRTGSNNTLLQSNRFHRNSGEIYFGERQGNRFESHVTSPE